VNSLPDDRISAQLRALQLDYVARLPARTAEIAARFDALLDKWNSDEATELRRLVHNLAGSGASYGFPALSTEARLVERALDETLGAAPSADRLEAVRNALRRLVAAAVAVRLD